MLQTAAELGSHVLWQYQSERLSTGDVVYHWLNLLEGAAWIGFGLLVLFRFARYRNSCLEIVYAAAFVLFGLSDFREAYFLQPWIIVAKGAILAALLSLRWIVIRRYYPSSRTY